MTSGEAFAAANAAMVRGVDGASTVQVLLVDCLQLLGADSAGVLLRLGDQRLELLAATSHQVVELELYQSQMRSGPCVETVETGRGVTASGDDELVQRWPDFGRAMAAADFHSVHATPMRWHERPLGGVNLFWHAPKTLSSDEIELAQAFADMCTLALMQPRMPMDPADVTETLVAALQGRVVIERAKGVLAETDGLEMADAFAELVRLSDERGEPLADVARTILRDIVTPRP
jgi:GAF domain-containing protein